MRGGSRFWLEMDGLVGVIIFFLEEVDQAEVFLDELLLFGTVLTAGDWVFVHIIKLI